MKRNYLAMGGSLLVVLIILFYLSPFSQVDYRTKCFSYPFSTAGNAGAQLESPCGMHVYGKTQYWPIFPLKPKNNDKADFCRSIVKDVETHCGTRVDEVILVDLGDYFNCDYLHLRPPGVIDYLVRVANYSKEALESKDAAMFGITRSVMVSEQKTNETDFVPYSGCGSLEDYLLGG